MTEMEALIQCRNMYAWLSITGSNVKYSYKPSQNWCFNCICCEHAGAEWVEDRQNLVIEETKDRNCVKCPLAGYAWKVPLEADMATCIEDPASLYDRWRDWDNTLHQYKYWAYRMVQACDKAIENILTNR